MINVEQIIFRIVVVSFLTLLYGCTSAQAASDMFESRISRLEVEHYQLRSQLNQLESQIEAISQSQYPIARRNRTAPLTFPQVSKQRLPNQQMFDRLATLVIELKQRISQLEVQVAELKEKVL
jgi:outer membrane murein-binding lipoprotein Lpp